MLTCGANVSNSFGKPVLKFAEERVNKNIVPWPKGPRARVVLLEFSTWHGLGSR